MEAGQGHVVPVALPEGRWERCQGSALEQQAGKTSFGEWWAGGCGVMGVGFVFIFCVCHVVLRYFNLLVFPNSICSNFNFVSYCIYL